MQNFKNSIKIIVALTLLCSSFALAQTISNKAPIVTMVMGPNGTLVPSSSTISNTASLSCVVNGVTISTSGSVDYNYSTSNPNTCAPLAPYTGLGNWTGLSNTGYVRYTFSQPIASVRVSYSSVNGNDIATLTTNSLSPNQFSNLCGVSVLGNIVSSTFGASTNYGTVGITIASATPFTTITLINTGGQSGWVAGNPCNFIIYPSSTIVNCPKISLGGMCYKASGPQHNTPFSVFNSATNGTFNNGCAYATINNVPANSSNVTIETLTPLPFGCVFNPDGSGRIIIPLGTNPFAASVYCRFRSIANPALFSEYFRVDFGINNRVMPADYNISLAAANPVYNGTTNVNLYSKRQQYDTGNCTALGTTASNVTLTDTTTPPNPYYTINAAGNLVLRPNVTIGSTVPVLPEVTYELTYSMCIPGSSVWCNTGRVVITYGYPLNKVANNSNLLEKAIIAPNPSSDGVCTILFDSQVKKVTVEVYNNMGQKMYEAQADGTKEHILVMDRLPKGNYVLKIKDEEQTIIKNIVKL